MKARMPKFGAVPVALFQEEGLTLADVRVYAVLAMFQGNNEDSYPSRETIAQNANISVESVSRAIAHLVEMGWAERDQRGFGKSNIYRVMVETEDYRNATGAISRNATGDAQEMLPVPYLSIKQKYHSKTPKEPSKLDSLFNPIKESFLSQGNFANYQKEAVCIKAIIKAIRNLTPDDAENTARRVLETFKALTSGNDKYWKDRPFLPSSLSPVIEQVWTIAKKGNAAPSMDWFDELERRHA